MFEQEQKTESYQNYVAECLRMISENTARMCGGTYMVMKFNEPAKTSPERDYKPGEVAERIKAKLRR